MKKIRIGNTITVKWAITTSDGSPYILTSENVELFASTPNHTIKAIGFSIAENIVTWIFRGNEQKYKGPYRLTLIENRGHVDMMTVDFCDAFCLVEYSCLSGGTDAAGVETESLELASTVSMSQIGLSPEVEEIIKNSMSDYGLFAIELDSEKGNLTLTRGNKTQFSGGELDETGELKINYNY